MSSSIKTLIIVSLLALIVLFGIVMVFLEVRSVNRQANDKAEQVRIERQRQFQSESVQETLQNNTQEINKLDSYIVSEDGTPDFLSRIETMGAITGATVETQSVDTSQISDETGEELLEISLTVAGSWQEIYRTVGLIETLPLKVTLTALKLSKRDVEGASLWEATIRLNVIKLASNS